MILCPNCSHNEMTGAVFCSECGAQLIPHLQASTRSIYSGAGGDAPGAVEAAATQFGDAATNLEETQAMLNILATGAMIPVSLQEEITLGRTGEGRPLVPDIDLTPYKAYEAGVSRMHASLRFENNTLMITDLGSANGTRLNGQPILANTPQRIQHGDILTLGKFKIQIYLHNP